MTPALVAYGALSLLLALIQSAEIKRIKNAVRGKTQIVHPISTGCVLSGLSVVLSPVWMLATLYVIVQVAGGIWRNRQSTEIDAGFIVLLLSVLLVGGRVPNVYATNTAEASKSPWSWLAAGLAAVALFYALGWIG